MTDLKHRAAEVTQSDLVIEANGRLRLPDCVHPLPNLLDLSASEILETFRQDQHASFLQVVQTMEQDGSPLNVMLTDLRQRAANDPAVLNSALFRPHAIRDVFLELHTHVLSHPVWNHPFFVRVFNGDITVEQLKRFACHYFNQIKNTRQCVALAIGRFHSLADLPFGALSEPLSEMTQISLAQLVADEYGVGTHAVTDYPDLGKILGSRTHIAIYRQLFDGLGIPPGQQDIPLLPEIADNVLTQRLVAGHPSFSPLEALASVGLGMEWGVPEFFSLLLGGIIRVAVREKIPLTQHHLEVFIAHVRYDVLHAVSVMLVTLPYVQQPNDLVAIKNACNMLMSSRYAMMSGLYRHIFAESCPGPQQINLPKPYHVQDRRIDAALRAARQQIPPRALAVPYASDGAVPFVFAS